MGGRHGAMEGAVGEPVGGGVAAEGRVRRARELLARLCEALPATADDVVEVIFTTGGATAAMLYPRRPWPRPLIARAAAAVAPSPAAAAILLECLAGVPAARQALRAAAAGAASLFFPI